MSDYKTMYLHLFRSVTEAMELLCEAQKKAEEVAEKLSETEERIIALIQSNAHITQKMLSEAIGMTRQYVGRRMDSLQARKIIRRIGPDKGGYWEVLKKGNFNFDS